MTLMTALEIFTQTNDLQIIVAEDEKTEKFMFLISRGPKHRFKPLISTKFAMVSREAAVSTVMMVLRAVCEVAEKEMQNTSSFPAAIINPEGLTKDEMQNVLTDKHLTQIEEKLQTEDTVNTFELFN